MNIEHLRIASHCRNMRIISYVEGQISSLNRNSRISTQHWISRNLFTFIPMLIGTFLLIWGWGIPRKSLWHRFWDTLYTGCPRRNVQYFGRVFLMLNCTDITQNTYIQSWTVMEIMAREFWNFDSCYTLIDYQIHIKTGRNMWFL